MSRIYIRSSSHDRSRRKCGNLLWIPQILVGAAAVIANSLDRIPQLRQAGFENAKRFSSAEMISSYSSLYQQQAVMKILHVISSVNPAGGGPIEGIKQLGTSLESAGPPG